MQLQVSRMLTITRNVSIDLRVAKQFNRRHEFHLQHSVNHSVGRSANTVGSSVFGG